MKKFILVLLLALLVGCSYESKMDEAQETVFRTALSELEEAYAVSLSLNKQQDTKYLDKKGGETLRTTSYIAYRYHDLLVDTQYINEETEIWTEDFARIDDIHSFSLRNRIHKDSREELPEDTSYEDLEALNIFFLHFADNVTLDDVTVIRKKNQDIYSVNVTAENYLPFLNIKDEFNFIEAEKYDLRDYTFVLEDGSLKNIILIYEASDAQNEYVVNVSIEIHALNEDVEIVYLDLIGPE